MKRITPRALQYLEERLAEVARKGLLRSRPAESLGEPTPELSFCSNDYLGLAERSAPAASCGSGASRLIAGERAVHGALEAAASDLVGQSAALVFSSGYAANVGAIAALAGAGDVVLSDALNHASIIDGARLSRARVEVFPHLDLDTVARLLASRRTARAFVVTESYFSMDADSPDLRTLRALCDRYEAVLVVDEAHALGVLGPEGRGLCAEAGIQPDVLVGTFGKAFGAGGAFVSGCPPLVDWLWNYARSFVFSTGLSPAVAAAALQGVQTARREPALRQRVLRNAQQLRDGLQRLGIRAGGFGHVVPWVVGDARRAMHLASELRERGLDVRAIRPPSVPMDTARIRLTVSARHGPTDIERALDIIGQTVGIVAGWAPS